MLTLIASCSLLGFSFNQQMASVVEKSKSPFQHIENGAMLDVIESKGNENPGLYLIRNPRLDRTVYENALANIQDVTVTCLAKKEADGSLVFWDAQGKAARPSTSNPKFGQNLKPGEVGLELVGNCRVGLNIDNTRPNHMILVPNTSFASGGPEVRTYGVMTHVMGDFVDVKIHVFERKEVGKIGAAVGSRTTIGRIKFQVAEDVSTEHGGNALRALFSKCDPAIRYSFVSHAKVGNSQARRENSEPLIPLREMPNGDREVLVLGEQPTKQWDELSIVRYTTIDGFLSHVPTHPASTP